MVRVLLVLITYHLSLITSAAQDRRFLHYDCMGVGALHSSPTATHHSPSSLHRLTAISTQWDSTRVYPVAVVLVAFADRAFSVEDPADRYNRLFNEEGYNEGVGPGCVADYFRSQSNGLFNLSFDIYGPVTLKKNCKNGGDYNYGSEDFKVATQQLVDSLKASSQETDFSRYDWDGDGYSEPFIYIYAGYGGNETVNEGQGYIWPNTSDFSTVVLNKPGEKSLKLMEYSASAELWSNDQSCGIGTICHEFCHTLGLPDLYPTSGDEFSVVDDWDLMDGGNYIDGGWCPPNFSAHEKMLFGWLKPEELTVPTAIDSLMPVAEGGKAYIVRTEQPNEFFLIENRQWRGWDLRTPGHGLLISHVDYDKWQWEYNSVNVRKDHHRYELVHADNLDYNEWEAIYAKGSQYIGGHSRYLSGTPYPFINDSVVNRALTDSTIPAATTFCGTGLLGKPITNITEHEGGSVSFRFMDEIPDGISDLTTHPSPLTPHSSLLFDLQGRRVQGTPRKGLYLRNGKKYIYR